FNKVNGVKGTFENNNDVATMNITEVFNPSENKWVTSGSFFDSVLNSYYGGKNSFNVQVIMKDTYFTIKCDFNKNGVYNEAGEFTFVYSKKTSEPIAAIEYNVFDENINYSIWGSPSDLDFKFIFVKKSDWATFNESTTPCVIYIGGNADSTISKSNLNSTFQQIRTNRDLSDNSTSYKYSGNEFIPGVFAKKENSTITVKAAISSMLARDDWMAKHNGATEFPTTNTFGDYYLCIVGDVAFNDPNGKLLWNTRVSVVNGSQPFTSTLPPPTTTTTTIAVTTTTTIPAATTTTNVAVTTTVSSVWTLEIPETYADQGAWGGALDGYYLKFIIVDNNSLPDSSADFGAKLVTPNMNYVYCQVGGTSDTFGNGFVDQADLVAGKKLIPVSSNFTQNDVPSQIGNHSYDGAVIEKIGTNFKITLDLSKIKLDRLELNQETSSICASVTSPVASPTVNSSPLV
ncbi:MAG TPA: hypothetical protein PK771_15135, partial [Spirochaetota bacterium]|nr:hypothetical protein [Spirochaetota bacterium]